MLARSETHHQPVGPIAFNCVKFIIIRAGSARLFNETAFIHVNVGDVVVLAANTLCGAEPEGRVTTTTIYLDSDYVVDQIFWQYAAQFRDRLDASVFLDEQHSEPTQLLRIGEESIGQLTPWLDELVELSVDGLEADRFYRAQALLSGILDVVVPHFAATSPREGSASRPSTAPSTPRHRIFQPLRTEARIVGEILASELDRRWSTAELANAVNLVAGCVACGKCLRLLDDRSAFCRCRSQGEDRPGSRRSRMKNRCERSTRSRPRELMFEERRIEIERHGLRDRQRNPGDQSLSREDRDITLHERSDPPAMFQLRPSRGDDNDLGLWEGDGFNGGAVVRMKDTQRTPLMRHGLPNSCGKV